MAGMEPDRPGAAVTPGDRADVPGLAVAAVARSLGVAPATLRTWDRRYGLGPSGHVPGRHRRYSLDDLARLELMQRELIRGVAPADAARFALAASHPAPGPTTVPPADPEPVRDSDGARAPVRVGGRLLRMPGASMRARGLGRAALAMDSAVVRGLLAEAVEAEGLVATWDGVVRPVLAAVADRWSSTGTGVEIEHLLSDSVTTVFNALAVAAGPAVGARPVVLAAMPAERHVLALTALAAVLAERQVPCRVLGADVPADALDAALRRTAPAAVVLWAQVPATADVAVLAGLPRTRPRYRTFVAGGGWAEAVLPDRIGRLDSLAGAAAALAEPTKVRAGR